MYWIKCKINKKIKIMMSFRNFINTFNSCFIPFLKNESHSPDTAAYEHKVKLYTSGHYEGQFHQWAGLDTFLLLLLFFPLTSSQRKRNMEIYMTTCRYVFRGLLALCSHYFSIVKKKRLHTAGKKSWAGSRSVVFQKVCVEVKWSEHGWFPYTYFLIKWDK